MINITSKENCSGCGACQQKCPKQCISLVRDDEGFLYPEVDTSKCIDCGLCERICHEFNPYDYRQPKIVLAANNKNEEVRLLSSSGGIFSLLAEKTISQGGIVFGARYDDNWQVVFDYTETIDGISAFRGSKYVQARTEDNFLKAEKYLKEGRCVLYSGTPCQIAGLKHYLQKEYENLITIDFVCHGVPSPKVWNLYLKEVSNAGALAISDIAFRNKDNGWKKFNFKIEYNSSSDSHIISSCHLDNTYMKAFLSNMILRPSCHNCKAKHGSSASDITIADFWGVANELPQMDDDKGTGLVLINTTKGQHFFPYNEVNYMESSFAFAANNNPGLNHIAKPHPNRTEFFKYLKDDKSITELISIELPILNWNNPKGLIKKLQKLINYRISTQYKWGGAIVNVINFRNKSNGWKSYCMIIGIQKNELIVNEDNKQTDISIL